MMKQRQMSAAATVPLASGNDAPERDGEPADCGSAVDVCKCVSEPTWHRD